MPEQNQLQIRPEAGELSVNELTLQVKKIQEVMNAVMKKGEHYGTIPGTNKPTLLKPGAEKLGLTFRFAPTFTIETKELPGGHREEKITCVLIHIPSGRVVGSGVGSCSTMESKYRWRHTEAESTGREVPREYWNTRRTNQARAQEMLGGKDFITRKIDGVWFICKKSDERMENPDIADVYNTVLKMAKKRAHVDAMLTATAASDIFTQDIEDFRDAEAADAASQEQFTEEKREPLPAQRPAGQMTATGPKVDKPKTTRSLLADEISSYCNGDEKGIQQILKALTGKESFLNVSEAMALTAREKFKLDYLDKIPPAANEPAPNGPEGPGPGDDLPL